MAKWICSQILKTDLQISRLIDASNKRLIDVGRRITRKNLHGVAPTAGPDGAANRLLGPSTGSTVPHGSARGVRALCAQAAEARCLRHWWHIVIGREQLGPYTGTKKTKDQRLIRQKKRNPSKLLFRRAEIK
jgi:hypothetical protein